jgi:hypothetical protein
MSSRRKREKEPFSFCAIGAAPLGGFTRGPLCQSLIDGWSLADEYHDMYKNRKVIWSGIDARVSSQGDPVLRQPTPAAVLKALCQTLATATEPVDAQQAA